MINLYSSNLKVYFYVGDFLPIVKIQNQGGVSLRKLKLALAGSTPYIVRLAEYIQKNGPEYLEVSECIKQEEIGQFLEKLEPDILLCECLDIMQKTISKNIVQILLSDAKNTVDENIPVIFRYQDGTAILRQVFMIYGQKTEKKLDIYCQSENFEMAAVYAPGGHELQLAFALAYAAICGENKKVLYLNLSEFSGMLPLTRRKEEENLSDLIYGIRQRKDKFLFFLESVLHHTLKYDYILSPNNPEDLYAISQSDLGCLLELLKEQTDYDTVIWNFGTLNQLAGEMLTQCSKVFCVVKESFFGKYRKKEFEQFLEKEQSAMLQKKIRYVSPQAGNGMFVQGESIFAQLQDGEFVGQVKRLIFQEKL